MPESRFELQHAGSPSEESGVGREGVEPISSAGRLVPVELAAKKSPKQHEPSCGLAVVLPGGRRIEVHPDFDTSTFERLVGILERA